MNKADGDDILLFGAGIQLTDLSFSNDGFDLIVTVLANDDNVQDQVRVSNWFRYLETDVVEYIGFDNNQRIDIREFAFRDFSTNFDDWITGGKNIDHLTGLKGEDVLIGREGADTLDGGDNADTLFGGIGADTLIGGAGKDTAAYYDSVDGVTVDLDGEVQTPGYYRYYLNDEQELTREYIVGEKIEVVNAGSSAQGDKLSTIENLIGSEFNDSLSGDSGSNNYQCLRW